MRLKTLGLWLLPIAGAAQAQYIDNSPELRSFTSDEIEAVEMPEIAFDMIDANPDDFEKYFFFHRTDTSFEEAYADVTECDALTSGLSYYGGGDNWAVQNAVMQYGLAGAVGGAIGSAMADAIFGSAERRKQRRINMRNCMFYKGYDRYGLEKDLWQSFHFEEGLTRENAEDRARALLQQARVASGPQPSQGRLIP